MNRFHSYSLLAAIIMLVLPLTAKALPFVPTADPSATTTHWYQIKTGSMYLYSSGYFCDLAVSSTSSVANEYLWCFVGDDTSGYKIYNRGAQSYMKGLGVTGSATDTDLSYYEAGSGNSFYIYHYFRNGLNVSKVYLCYDSSNGLYGSDTKYNSYTVNEFVEAPMIETPYNSLTAYYFDIPHNSLNNTCNEGYAKLIDKNRSTKWCVVNKSGAWETIVLEFMSDIPFIPNSYCMSTALDASGYPNRNPKAWKILAKAKLSDEWTVLADVTDGASAGLGTQNGTDYMFAIPGCTKPYQYFHFEVSEIRGKNTSDNSYTFQLADLQFQGTPVPPTAKGDISGDGVVDVDDVNAVINIILKTKTESDYPGSADVSGDGVVDVEDVNKIINIILKVGNTETYTVNGVTFKMVNVEGGAFLMGDQTNDVNYPNQRPVHLVMVDSYSIGQTEVTQELWRAVMGDSGTYFMFSSQFGYDDNPQRPAEGCVTWNKCQAFITKLNEMTGKNFRLPTEAEWEFAARGGNLSKGYLYAGSNNMDDVAWYRENSDMQTQSVGTKAPNELGLYDMSGNVEEWCQDYYDTYTLDPQVNPTGPETGTYRVARGSSWHSYPTNITYRFYSPVDQGSNTTGLRLAK